ncbi:hypothetical protein AHAS_Ahas11G0259600 [Arachis hypogaea]
MIQGERNQIKPNQKKKESHRDSCDRERKLCTKKENESEEVPIPNRNLRLSEESDVSGSDGDDTSWFCNLRGNEFFCEMLNPLIVTHRMVDFAVEVVVVMELR